MLPLRAMLIPSLAPVVRFADADSAAIGTAISGLETLEGQAQGLETDVSDAQIARDSFFGAGGAGEGYADSAAIGAEASRVEGLGADFDGLEAAVVTAQGDVDTFFGTDGEGDGFADSAAIGDAAADAEEFAAGLPVDSEFADSAQLAASQLRELETEAQTVEGALADAQGAVGSFFVDGAGSEFADEADLQAVADGLRSDEGAAQGLETDVSDAQIARDGFFGAGGAGEGYADSFAIGTAISGLETLEGQAQGLEGALADAQSAVGSFFVDGAGSEFADEADLQSVAGGLRSDEGAAQGLEGALAGAQGAVGSFFVDGAGSEFADEADLQSIAGGLRSDESAAQALESDVLLLSDALDATDNLFETSPMFDSASFNAGIGAREIGNLADLNVQIGDSIVTRDIAAVDDTAHTVSLTPAEVDRLGEGSVQIEATQTDAVGNLHEGGAATNSFVIDTIDPFVVTIADDQSGIAFDGANTVEYTLTFSEAVQSDYRG